MELNYFYFTQEVGHFFQLCCCFWLDCVTCHPIPHTHSFVIGALHPHSASLYKSWLCNYSLPTLPTSFIRFLGPRVWGFRQLYAYMVLLTFTLSLTLFVCLAESGQALITCLISMTNAWSTLLLRLLLLFFGQHDTALRHYSSARFPSSTAPTFPGPSLAAT